MSDPTQDKLFNFLDENQVCQQEVWRNRQDLAVQLGLTSPPQWLIQEHGVRVAEASEKTHMPHASLVADACVSRSLGHACVIQSADCLPVLLSSLDGSVVAAAHAGWRGLAAGVVEATVKAMGIEPACLSAYLGPAISQSHFEVGSEVREAFLGSVEGNKALIERCFIPSVSKPGYFLADLYQLASLELRNLGITRIFGGDYCTYADSERFYSYRRQGQTGRMVSMIWIDSLSGV